jgi:hypothetical protein
VIALGVTALGVLLVGALLVAALLVAAALPQHLIYLYVRLMRLSSGLMRLSSA